MTFDIASEKLNDRPRQKLSSSPSPTSMHKANLAKFEELVATDIDNQMQVFLKSFIFILGDDWKKVGELSSAFKQYLLDTANRHDLNVVQAADFLQKQGRTRTALQRKEELKDIDLDCNGRICFIEYVLLHYKAAILESHFSRRGEVPTVSLENHCVGVTGVGVMLLDELFKSPVGMDEELARAIEEFVAKKRQRDNAIADLSAKAKRGGVKGMTALTELRALQNADMTEMNRVEITLAAAKRRWERNGGTSAEQERQRIEEEKKRNEKLRENLEREEKEAKQKLANARAKLRARAAFFEN